MSSPFTANVAAVALLCSVFASGCDNHDDIAIAPSGSEMESVQASALIPAGGALHKLPNPAAGPYYESAEAVTSGMKLYRAYNCVGCHFNGGGGMGPPLMDKTWIYGGRLDQIYNSIYQGRPNGMPVWGGKIPNEQMWQIAAYVRSMSLPETLAANDGGTPSRHPAPVPVEADLHGGWSPPDDTVGE